LKDRELYVDRLLERENSKAAKELKGESIGLSIQIHSNPNRSTLRVRILCEELSVVGKAEIVLELLLKSENAIAIDRLGLGEDEANCPILRLRYKVNDLRILNPAPAHNGRLTDRA